MRGKNAPVPDLEGAKRLEVETFKERSTERGGASSNGRDRGGEICCLLQYYNVR